MKNKIFKEENERLKALGNSSISYLEKRSLLEEILKKEGKIIPKFLWIEPESIDYFFPEENLGLVFQGKYNKVDFGCAYIPEECFYLATRYEIIKEYINRDDYLELGNAFSLLLGYEPLATYVDKVRIMYIEWEKHDFEERKHELTKLLN